jgi:predicted transcriptional regulator
MKSVRLDARLQARLRQAARSIGVSESEVIRQAVSRRTGEILAGGLDQRLEGIVGAITSRGGRADQTGRRFTELLKRRDRRSKPKTRS